MKRNRIETIAKTGVMIALVFVVTAMLVIPMPYGYLNLGDSVIMFFAKFEAFMPVALAASLGSALADLFLGFSSYAIFTFIIKGLEGICMYLLFKKLTFKYSELVVFLVGALIMLVGYGVADVILASEVGVFIPSIIANLPQAIGSYLVAIIGVNVLGRIYSKYVVKK